MVPAQYHTAIPGELPPLEGTFNFEDYFDLSAASEDPNERGYPQSKLWELGTRDTTQLLYWEHDSILVEPDTTVFQNESAFSSPYSFPGSAFSDPSSILSTPSFVSSNIEQPLPLPDDTIEHNNQDNLYLDPGSCGDFRYLTIESSASLDHPTEGLTEPLDVGTLAPTLRRSTRLSSSPWKPAYCEIGGDEGTDNAGPLEHGHDDDYVDSVDVPIVTQPTGRPRPSARPTKKGRGKVKFPCSFIGCTKMFGRENDAKRHWMCASEHEADRARANIVSPSSRCGHCGESLSREDARRRHERDKSCGKRSGRKKGSCTIEGNTRKQEHSTNI